MNTNTYIEEILSSKIATYTSTSTQATNSQRKHIKEIFNLILTENLKYTNEYGYSEIPYKLFAKIDNRNYSTLLHWLEANQLIQIRRGINGKESYSGIRNLYIKTDNGYLTTDTKLNDAFCKGYKIDPDLIENSGILLTETNENEKTLFKKILSKKSAKQNTPIIEKQIDEQIEKTEKVNWHFDNSWNSLTLSYNEGLSNTLYKKYSDGLKKTYSFKDGRYFGQFHFMNKEHIQYLRLFNEKIQEWGDGTAFFTKLIGKLIEDIDYIPFNEKVKFQQFAINDPYIILMKKLYLKDRDEAKTLLNVYVNSINSTSARMKNIDEYFKNNFPCIREWLRNIPTIKVKNNNTGKMEKKKQLWKLNQNMEYKIMSTLAKNLNKDYGVFPLTKHDAIYFNSSDIEKLNKNNVIFSTEMKKTLNYQYYNDLIFEI